MPDATPTHPAATPNSPTGDSAADAALFGKYTAQHQAALAAELGPEDDHATQAPSPPSKNGRRADAGKRPAPQPKTAPAGATGNQPARDASGKFLPRDGAASGAAGQRAAGTADAASDDADGDEDSDGARATGAEGAADDPRAGDADPATPGVLSEAEAVALLRTARASGDQAGIDRALKALLPDSKGLSEFQVDGNRYAEFRQTVKREKDKLAERDSELNTRERNVSTGLAQVETLVARYQPYEELVQLAQREDDDGVEAFVTLVQKLTKKPLNETVKRHLDRKLSKPSDPEVDALRRELKSEKDKREARERQEAEARQLGEQRDKIQRHLVFLDQELGKSPDPRVVALVKTPAGMRAIFEAQKAHYDARTGVTLSPEQAARYVLEQKQKELEPWQAVLGGAPAPAKTETPPSNIPAAGNHPAAQARRAKSLGGRGAAASGGTRRLNDTELFEKYERLARLAGD